MVWAHERAPAATRVPEAGAPAPLDRGWFDPLSTGPGDYVPAPVMTFGRAG